MIAHSERHLEDWIVQNFNRFGEPCSIDYMPSYKAKDIYQPTPQTFIWACFEKLLSRQTRLPSGIPDLIASHKTTIAAIELKKTAITYASIGQCTRYMYDLREIFYEVVCDAENDPSCHYDAWLHSNNVQDEISGMVVGNSFEDENIPLAAVGCGVIPVLYEYDGVGYHFKYALPDGTHQDNAYREFAYGVLGESMKLMMRQRALLQGGK